MAERELVLSYNFIREHLNDVDRLVLSLAESGAVLKTDTKTEIGLEVVFAKDIMIKEQDFFVKRERLGIIMTDQYLISEKGFPGEHRRFAETKFDLRKSPPDGDYSLLKSPNIVHLVKQLWSRRGFSQAEFKEEMGHSLDIAREGLKRLMPKAYEAGIKLPDPEIYSSGKIGVTF